MRLEQATRALLSADSQARLTDSLETSAVWTTASVESRPFFVASTFLDRPVKTLVLVASHDRALAWQAKLGLYGVPQDRIRILPSGLSALFEDAAPETIALSERLGALRLLADPSPCIVVAPVSAALERTLPVESLRDHLVFRPGDTVDSMEAIDKLKSLGYEPADPVRVPGQYSRRGGILDIFPTGADEPVRIEFFDDEIESLRVFDSMSQRSIRPVDELELGLTRETLLAPPDNDLAELLERTLAIEAAKLDREAASTLESLVEADIVALNQRIFFNRLDLYRPVVHPDGPSALDYLGDDGLLVIDEPLELESIAERAEDELGQALDARHRRGEILHAVAHDFVASFHSVTYGPRWVALSSMNALPTWMHADGEVDLDARSLESYRGQPVVLTQALTNWLKEGLSVVYGTDQPNRARAVLSQVEIFAAEGETEPSPGSLVIVDGNPAGGFVSPSLGFALLTDHELFGVGRLKLPQRKFSDGVPIATVLDLKPGDYVVHINFGVGVYQGLVKKEVGGVEKEFLHLEYKAPDRLFVPADQLDRVQKYMSPEDGAPKVNRLTGGEWKKAVAKAREDAREFARELIQLYAERKAVDRQSYGPDSPWQSEMEATFPWVETPSQQAAIDEVKRDLQTDYPMDRLVCGDVGFGKTEVAVRAAFKVAEAGRQVAVLCPTTILSEQHHRNFAERLAAFPTKVGLLNRFVTANERRKTLEGLKSGDVDIVIGTHALLSESLQFKNLGMLIIDEEQKFGVKHKEALKSLRVNVDVLSMSATPIPRTLSMALMNVRQMSLINDPPPGRLPVRTFVRPYGDEVVREAVLRELARGGQVFYVTHRVQGINHIAERIRKLVPTARVGVGHGQMTEKELEPVMVGFVKGEIDVLVSTTIVESGLDIPNANTLIVENADRFGLSQLYQLRGRVGRSDRQAYSYMLYQGSKELTENAGERLRALAEFTQLGAGYSLAFRDLQIRGAGDLLGAKQTGHMTAVGYDLYTQLIESEVNYLKTFADGERPKSLQDPLAGIQPLPAFDLPVKALVPQWYVEDEGQRLYTYKQIMGARTPEMLAGVHSELEDRYGHMPEEVLTALSIMGVRIKAVDAGIQSVDGSQGRLLVRFMETRPLHPRVLALAQRSYRSVYQSGQDMVWPYSGDPVVTSHEMVDTLLKAKAEMESHRESLGV